MNDMNIVDCDRSACLCAEGAPGYVAATAVGADGSEHLLLALVDALGDETVRYDPTCADVAPHEQLGALPGRYQLGLRCVPLRCGRRTAAGRPCRAPVTQPGGTCGWHRSEATAPSRTDNNQ
jgi:hypothetical protein